MTRIGMEGIEALAAVIRRQVRTLSRPAAAAVPSALAPRDGKTRKNAKREDLASVVARRVRAVDPADPDAHAQAFKVFLESVLLSEFGDHVINDPAFHQLVENVFEQMSANPELAVLMRQASGILLWRAP